MRKFVLAAASLAAMAMLSVMPASAQSRLALVIGNSAYTGAPPLPTTVADATSIMETLKAAGYDVTGLSDLNKDLLVPTFRDFIAKVAAAGPDAVVFIYYAGHGAQLNADDYLIPTDAQINTPDDLVSQALPLSALIGELAKTPSAARIIVLDASRDAGFGKQAGAALPPGLALVGAPAGFLVAYAAAPNEVEIDGPGPNSPFAAALATLMRQPGLDIEQIFKGVRLQVNQASKGTQTPWMTSALSAEVKLFDAPAAPNPGLNANAQAAPKTLAPALGVANIPVPPKTKRRITKREMQQMSSDDAYRTAIEDDSLEDYQWFVETHPHYSLAGQIWDIITNRRESVLWHRTLTLGSTRAYWNYLKRFPNGAHAWEARNRLYSSGQPLPPSDYVAVADDLPPGYYDEAVGLPDIVRDGFGRPAAVFGPLAPLFIPDPPRWDRRRPTIVINVAPSQPAKNLQPSKQPVTPIQPVVSPVTTQPVNPAQPISGGQQVLANTQPVQPVPPINQQPVTPLVACPNQAGNVTVLCGGATASQQTQVNDLVKRLQAEQNKKSATGAGNPNLKSMTDQQLKEEAAKAVKHWQDEQKKKNDALAKKYNLPQGTPVLAMHPANATEQKKIDDALAKLSPADRAKLPQIIGSIEMVQ